MGMGIGILQLLLFAVLAIFALAISVHAQDQSGFISIDCGLAANTTYTDADTGLAFTSDASFIESGVPKNIALPFNSGNIYRQQKTLRSFPEGDRNCYNVTVVEGNKYLIRGIFYYGNYDGQNILPNFDLHFNSDKWATVKLLSASSSATVEIIHIVQSKYVYICLVNTGNGVPFISSLEFRPLHNGTYETTAGSLVLFTRLDVGSVTNKTVRYPDDVYDRLWTPYHFSKWADISTSQKIDAEGSNYFWPPSAAMRTAGTPSNASEAMQLYIDTADSTLQFYVYMHVAEIFQLTANESRQFNITLNGKFWSTVIPTYLSTTTVYSPAFLISDEGKYIFSLFKTGGSTLPPLLNAIEVYSVVEISQSTTDKRDVNAITSIKSKYGMTRNWQGDPCTPTAYVWQGLNCSYPNADSPRIISLNLSSSGLMGNIAPEIASLKLLQYLDLSNNSFNGSVPDIFAQLTSLKLLNLAGNQLTGTIPADLYARSETGSLTLIVDPILCPTESCNSEKKTATKKKKSSAVVPVAASLAAILAVIVAGGILFWFFKQRKRPGMISDTEKPGKVEAVANKKHEPLESQNRQFTYSEILKITNNFQRVIGKGGFGTVYLGHVDNTQVAVKMLSPSSVQGYKEFHAEVRLLLRVHHRNLTSLVGYCEEQAKMGLIYEYMANGNLHDHLSESCQNTISWEGRLRIAVEAAQGLEYLHNGCKPQIVHRDVKTTNILLNDKFQAKMADFGLSRTFPAEGGTHVSTIVAGTPGYLDPEYYVTNWLTDKSDVYSFGVVLLEIVTSQPVIDRTKEQAHISPWVSSVIQNGDIKNLVDRRLYSDYDINSVWKVVELAMACLSATSAKRPTMSQVVIELNECVAMEMARVKAGNSAGLQDSSQFMTVNMQTEPSPLAR